MEKLPEKVKPKVGQTILEGASKLELIRHFGKLTLKKVIEGNYPSIGAWEKEITAPEAEKLTTVMIAELSSSFNDDLTEEAIDELTVEIHSSIYRNLSYEDLFLVTKELKRSEIKFKLTLNKVIKALEQHHVNKCDAIYKNNREQHLSTKFRDNTPLDIEGNRKANQLAKTYYDLNKQAIQKESEKWNQSLKK